MKTLEASNYGGYCCAPGDDYGDWSEMIRYELSVQSQDNRYDLSLIGPNIDTIEFKCIHYRHLIPKSNFLQSFSKLSPTFVQTTWLKPKKAQNINRRRTILTQIVNFYHNFMTVDTIGLKNCPLRYGWKNFELDQMATFLHFASRNPDLRRGKLLQINQVYF